MSFFPWDKTNPNEKYSANFFYISNQVEIEKQLITFNQLACYESNQLETTTMIASNAVEIVMPQLF